jgi:hypothetical protein
LSHAHGHGAIHREAAAATARWVRGPGPVRQLQGPGAGRRRGGERDPVLRCLRHGGECQGLVLERDGAGPGHPRWCLERQQL